MSELRLMKGNEALAEAAIRAGVDEQRASKIQEEFIRKQASLNDRDDIIQAIDSLDKPYFEDWLFEFGGELKHSKSFFPLIWSGLKAPEYTLPEAIELAQGSSFSSANMKYNVLSDPIYDHIKEYSIPIYFLVGTSDYTTPHQLITEYFEMVKAPEKNIIYFPNSAHFPFFEEPEAFCDEMNRLLLNLD